MEVESFEDEGVAKLLNDGFVSIKVSCEYYISLHVVSSSCPISRLLISENFGSIRYDVYFYSYFLFLTRQFGRWTGRKDQMWIR